MDLTTRVKQGESGLVDIESERAIQEVQAALVIAKRFPRDMESSPPTLCYPRIAITACSSRMISKYCLTSSENCSEESSFLCSLKSSDELINQHHSDSYDNYEYYIAP